MGVALTAFGLAGCGDDSQPACEGVCAAGGAGAAGGSTSTSTTGVGAGGMGGVGGMGGDAPYIPSPDDIQFAALAPLPAGEQLLINDWSPVPNVVRSIKTDGTGSVDVFQAYRIWSMGTTPDGSSIAFSSGDPLQEQHYGLTFNDSIQHSFLYDADQQSAKVVAYGNINDECHIFGNSGALYVCRRYDFQPAGAFSGWRLAQIDLDAAPDPMAAVWLTPQETNVFHLLPAPTPDESSIYYTRIVIQGASQTRAIMRLNPGDGTEELFLADASGSTLSPNGELLAYSDVNDAGNLYVVPVAGGAATAVALRPGTEMVFSPDGSSIAYLLNDASANCSHVEIVAVDGSQADDPFRAHDCAAAGDFVTELAWIDR